MGCTESDTSQPLKKPKPKITFKKNKTVILKLSDLKIKTSDFVG